MPPMPDKLDASRLGELLADHAVVDLRTRGEAEMESIRGAVSIPFGRQFPTWVGSVFGPTDRIVLLARDEESAGQAAKWCALVGNRAVGWILTDEALTFASSMGLLAQTPKTRAEELPGLLGSHQEAVLDVRKASEVAEGSIPGVCHFPLARLGVSMGELPEGKRLHVHCASGMRALVAASFLRAKGYDACAVTEPFPAVQAACLGVGATP